jgi:peptidoglycan biosynthesis protein MviN/MurJ (putative lipid II flippase)
MSELLYFISASLILAVSFWIIRRRHKGHFTEIERFIVVFSAFIATCCACAASLGNPT